MKTTVEAQGPVDVDVMQLVPVEPTPAIVATLWQIVTGDFCAAEAWRMLLKAAREN